MYSRFFYILIKILVILHVSLLSFFREPVVAQLKNIETQQFTMPIKFENFGWRDYEVLGVNILHKGVSLLSENVKQQVTIDQKEPIDISISYTIKDFPHNSRAASIVFSGDNGDFSKTIQLYSNKNPLNYNQIGGLYFSNDKLRIPEHILAGHYEIYLKLDSGDIRNIPGTIKLSANRVVEINQKLSQSIEISYRNLFYGELKGRNISIMPRWGGMLLNRTGSRCIGYINNHIPQNLIFTVRAIRKGKGRGIPVFGFYINGQLIKKFETEDRNWSDYEIPVHLDSGEHEFAIQSLAGGNYRSISVEKISVENIK